MNAYLRTSRMLSVSVLLASLVSLSAHPAVAQSSNTGKPSEARSALSALAVEVEGTVEWASAGASPSDSKGWSPVKLKQELVAGTQIRTGLRSHVNLQFGETTFISLRGTTHASLDQLYRSATTETVRIGLGYGTVRGGSVEGKVRSDVRVDSTVATLAKRGTEGWEMNVEPMTRRFRISLAEYGLVEAISKLRGASRSTRTVRPGEYATDTNLTNLWINQDIFDRNVQFYQVDAISAADADFSNVSGRGYGVLAPGGGSTLVDASARSNADFVLEQAAQNFGRGTLPPTTVVVPPLRRPDGDFGTTDTFKVFVPRPTRAAFSAASSRTLLRPRTR